MIVFHTTALLEIALAGVRVDQFIRVTEALSPVTLDPMSDQQDSFSFTDMT